MKLIWLTIIFFVTGKSVAAAGDDTIVLTPQWTAQAQFAGYYIAETKGFYREAGVNVRIEHPLVTQPAMTCLRQGKCQAAILQLCQAMKLVDDGIPLVNILQTSMNNAIVIVSARGKNPLTQKGERVGIWSVGSSDVAICMSAQEHLDYKWVPFAHNINLFVAGALDATLSMSYNEYFQLMQAGVELSEKNVYRFCDHRYNVQEDGIYVRRDYYMQHRDQLRRFAAASRRGWEWAAEHEEEALDIVMKYVTKYRVNTNLVMQKLMLHEILRLQIDRESGHREFRLRPDMVSLACSLMKRHGLLKHDVTYDQLVEPKN